MVSPLNVRVSSLKASKVTTMTGNDPPAISLMLGMTSSIGCTLKND